MNCMMPDNRGKADSRQLYENLKASGLPDSQARAIATAIGTASEDHASNQEKILAQKVDTARFDGERHRIEASLKHEIQGVRTAIAETKFEMLRWLFVFWVGQVAATVSSIKLLR